MCASKGKRGGRGWLRARGSMQGSACARAREGGGRQAQAEERSISGVWEQGKGEEDRCEQK